MNKTAMMAITGANLRANSTMRVVSIRATLAST